ncbi:sugar phosphate isomerase/epimerase family protein [Hoeflea ulvae]|uniref:Sugar phosphate isomerase/epimerase n=1 Tax=Hoeflea ulvae TaxID=2983764 RepID=A0ABT3YC20_9HYPH|nr:sugar phosphate isomerase/epimerase [Hoeflea ulvae]MCY0093424.1 sugar phosphate isomerase/epimerase [Hoeflea ulvae]
MRTLLAHLTLSTTAEQTVDAAAFAGFDGVGIRICGRNLHDDSFVSLIGDRAAIRSLRRTAESGGVEIHNISAYQFYPDLTKDHLDRVVDTAGEIGAKVLVVNCFIEDEALALDLFSHYAMRAREAGLRLALEFLPYSVIVDLRAAERFLKLSGASDAGILLDALHLERSGDVPADIARVDPEKIVFAQLCDAKAGTGERDPAKLMQEARTARLRLGAGDLPLRAFVEALPVGLDLEYEVADLANKHLPPRERAVAAKADFDAFRASVVA